MNTARPPFLRLLQRHQRCGQAGVLACGALRGLRVAVLLFAAYALLDYLLAFSSPAMLGLNGLLLLVVAALLAWEVISAVGVTREETARRIDQLTGSRRQPVLTALELQSTHAAGDEMSAFLVDKALGEAADELQSLSARHAFPWRELRRQALRLLLAVALTAGLLAANAPAARAVLARIRQPQADLPPYSPYRFTITPAAPRVLYGGALDVRVEVAGGPLRQGVELWTRQGGVVNRTPCFREGATKFSQRLERVIDPVEFCFALGRARSEWRRVEVVLQPRVAMVKLRLEPPAYTQLAAREFVLGEESFAGYRGSQARLQLTSNRPLARGALTVTPLDGLGEARLVTAEKAGEHSLSFTWDIRQRATLEIRVEDVRGTALAEPLRLTQQVIPDAPPEVSVHTPPPYSLATPSSVIPFKGSATDDLALRSVELVRTVVGFRDRTTGLAPVLPEKRHEFARELNLAKLGVLAGQVLELYFEARDFNPDRTGIGASDIVRIEIIPETEYAEMIRANETREQFLARYYAMQERLAAFDAAVEGLHAELARPQPDAKKTGALLEQARTANQELREFVAKLTGEFHAYEMEAAFAGEMEKMSARLQERATLLQGMQPDSPHLPEVVKQLMADLLAERGKLREQIAAAEEAAKVGALMEQAGAFTRLLARQRQVVRQLQRFDPATDKDLAELGYYGKQQAAVLEELRELLKNLPAAANGLPSSAEYEKLRQDSLEFAKQLAATGAEPLMGEAVSASGNQDGPKAHRAARLALERLEALLKKRGEGECQFAGMCQGGMKFSPREELRNTLAQMLQSLLGGGKPGERGAQSGGGGGPGDGSDGFWVPSQTRLNTPMFGPARMSFQPGGVQGTGGRGGAGGPSIGHGGRETLTSPKDKPAQAGARSPELAPAQYRDAVKRYFNQTEERR